MAIQSDPPNRASGPEVAARTGLATLGIVAASIGFGIVPFFARSLMAEGIAAHSVAFFRFALTALVLLPVLWWYRSQWPVLLWGIGAGVVMGIGWIGYVRALDVAPVGTVGVLYMTYPVFTLLIGWALFSDTPSWRALLASGLIVFAAAISATAFAPDSALVVPLLMSLAAPLGFGFGICVLVHRLTPVPPLARMGCLSLGSVIGLLPLILLSERAEVLPAQPAGWMLVAGIALATALLPQLLYTACSPMIGTARTAIAGAVELPAMFMLGWIAYGEPVGPTQWIAGALVLTAIVLTPTRVTRNVTTNLSRASRSPN